jgi:hypothetical protein
MFSMLIFFNTALVQKSKMMLFSAQSRLQPFTSVSRYVTIHPISRGRTDLPVRICLVDTLLRHANLEGLEVLPLLGLRLAGAGVTPGEFAKKMAAWQIPCWLLWVSQFQNTGESGNETQVSPVYL